MTDIAVVSLLSNRHLRAELTFHQHLKVLGQEKRSIINVKADSGPRNRSENGAFRQNC